MTFSWLNKGLDYTPPVKRKIMPLGKLVKYSQQHWVPYTLYLICIGLISDITGPYIGYTCAVAVVSTALLVYIFQGKYPELTFKGTTPAAWIITSLVGIFGIFLWIAPYHFFEDIMYYQIPILGNENIYLSLTFGGKSDPTYLPFEELAKNWQIPFIAVRMFGAVLMVPLFEELAVRSLVTRFSVDEEYKKVPVGFYTKWSFIIAFGISTFAHPWWFVAVLWSITLFWIYYYYKNILLCVWAHLIANLILAIYVLETGHYYLW
jgi:hypothetical protein